MSADVGYYSIVINQGSTFDLEFTLLDDDGNPVDLTGTSVRGQIRKTYSSTTPVATFTLVGTLSSDGRVLLRLSATETANISSGKYVYDVEWVNGSTVSRILEGKVIVRPEVTK